MNCPPDVEEDLDGDERSPLVLTKDPLNQLPLRHMWYGIRRSSFLLAIFLVFYLTFLSLGAVVFGSLEVPVAMQNHLQIRSQIENFRLKHPAISGIILLACSSL